MFHMLRWWGYVSICWGGMRCISVIALIHLHMFPHVGVERICSDMLGWRGYVPICWGGENRFQILILYSMVRLANFVTSRTAAVRSRTIGSTKVRLWANDSQNFNSWSTGDRFNPKGSKSPNIWLTDLLTYFLCALDYNCGTASFMNNWLTFCSQ